MHSEMMMHWLDSGLDAALYFVLLALAFAPLERAFAANKQSLLRREFFTDFCFYFGQGVLFVKLTLYCLWFAHDWFAQLAHSQPILAGVRATFAQAPVFVQLVGVVLISDLCIYWAHRLSHSNALLWRFHRVHHSALQLDWAAAFREHPLDNIYTRVIVNLPALLLGFPLELIAGLVVFRGLWGNFIHANVNLDPGPLRYLLGSPRLHHWHHEPVAGMRCNFANLNPLMDLLFGTYYDPGRMPDRYGIDGDRSARGYFAQLITPFVPERVSFWVRPGGRSCRSRTEEGWLRPGTSSSS